MSEIAEEMKRRTMKFALDVCDLVRQLPNLEPGPIVKRQLARSATGLAFNYRASCRARSHTEFTAKIGLVSEEADESQGWLEFIDASRLVTAPALRELIAESTELVRIVSASYATARANERQRHEQRKRRKDAKR